MNTNYTQTYKKAWQNDLNKFNTFLPVDSNSKTLVILKGHLLLEDLLRNQIDQWVVNPKELDKAKLGFSQTLYLVKSFKANKPDEWFWNAALQVNKLRNLYAHNLEPKQIEKKIKDFINNVLTQTNMKEIYNKETDFMKLAGSIALVHTFLSMKSHEHLALAEGLIAHSKLKKKK